MTEPAQENSASDAGAEDALLARRMREALSAIGSWPALQDDDEFEALDRIRHQSRPTPPVEDELGDL